VTINPAIQLGIDKRVGSIETGKDADLVIYNHHPLSVYAVAQKVFIDGHLYFDREKDLAMRAENAKERKELLEKEKKAAEAEKKPGEGKGGAEKKPGAPTGKEAQPKVPTKPPRVDVVAIGDLD
jgi:adenine deaminase